MDNGSTYISNFFQRNKETKTLVQSKKEYAWSMTLNIICFVEKNIFEVLSV